MNTRHQTFVLEMIKHGDKLRAYQKAYPKAQGESARKAAERLLRNPKIAGEINDAVAAIRTDAYREAYMLSLAEQKVKLLSIMRKREILTQIATCEMKVGRYIKDEGCYRMVYEDPRPRDIIKAIEVDTRLEEACNRARNIHDPQLSEFDIYIDGRPCDDPTGPVNTDIPAGLVMLPRKRKKNLQSSTGNKTEQFEVESTPSLLVEKGPGGEVNPFLTHKLEHLTEKHLGLLHDPLSCSFYKHFIRARDEANPHVCVLSSSPPG